MRGAADKTKTFSRSQRTTVRERLNAINRIKRRHTAAHRIKSTSAARRQPSGCCCFVFTVYSGVPVFVNERVEGKSVAPARREVADVDVRVAGRLHLTPEQQRIFRRFRLAAVRFFHRDVLNLQ